MKDQQQSVAVVTPHDKGGAARHRAFQDTESPKHLFHSPEIDEEHEEKPKKQQVTLSLTKTILAESIDICSVSAVFISLTELVLSGEIVHHVRTFSGFSLHASEEEEASYIRFIHELILVRILFAGCIYISRHHFARSWSEQARLFLTIFFAATALNLSLAAAFLYTRSYFFLSQLEACVDSSLVKVYGKQPFFFPAYMCEVEHISTHTCSCVTSSMTCFSYASISDEICHDLITITPVETAWSIGFALAVAVICLLVIISRVFNLVFGSTSSNREREMAKSTVWHIVTIILVITSIMMAYWVKKANALYLEEPHQDALQADMDLLGDHATNIQKMLEHK